MDETLVTAIDAGPTQCGWALVRVGAGRGTFLAGGIVATDDVESIFGTAEIIAVETPNGFAYSPARGAALVDTGIAAGIIIGIAKARGRRIVRMPASAWRLEVCGRSGAKDGDVKDKVSAVVDDMPKRSNAHVRDAIGLALAVGWAEAKGATP